MIVWVIMGQLGIFSKHSVLDVLVGRLNCNMIEKLYIFYVYNIFYGCGYILSNTIFLQFYPILFDTFSCQALWCYSIINAIGLFTGCCATLRSSDAIWRHRSGSTLAQWLVAWRHQAITWTNVDLSSVRSCSIHLRAIIKHNVFVILSHTIWYFFMPGCLMLFNN